MEDPADDNNDPRFTAGLLYDVFKLLEQHGYKQGPEAADTSRALVALLQLTRAYEGRPDPR